MEFVYNLIVILHFIGLASVVGGFLVQMKSADKGVNPAMLHGALTQLVTGVLMVGLIEGGAVDYQLDMTKISVKLLITVIITILAFVGRKKTPPQVGFWAAIGALSIANIFIAVLWS
jgi:NO-binding membrane sensor protein with MHYT domain